MLRYALIFSLLLPASPLIAATAVSRHEVGPWPVISRLIGYRDRIWFVNSVKGVNHNSADLHSLPVQGGAPRYEGHLFSQDAGDPVVHRGLLYWPLEDARAEPGIGAFDVIDGERWRHGLIPTGQAFHNHAMVAVDDRLYAALSAWKASLARSEDGGETWRRLYLHPTPDRRVSRITRLVALENRVYGMLNAPEGQRLIRVDDGSGDPLAGWPGGRSDALVVHGGSLYGIARNPDTGGLWRSDGERSERIWSPPEAWTPRALASDGERLWMAGEGAAGASLWSSPDGRDWAETVVLEGGSPRDLIAYRGVVAVGGRGADDRGVLWMFRPSAGAEPAIAPSPPSWPSPPPAAPDDYDWAGATIRLDGLLADPASYQRYGQPLEDAILALPRRGVPTAFYPDRLTSTMPSDPLPMFGDIVLHEMAVMGRWRVYWGMGLSRTGAVDAADILRPWDYTPTGPFKFFSTPEIAIWAAGRLGRPEADVLNALVQRIEDESTPLWLKGDAVGALFSITGERFGYDAEAWRGWLNGRS